VSEQALDLRTSTAILRRRWRLLALAAGLGAALGTAYAVTAPPRMSSMALVLLPPAGTSSSDPAKVSATQTTIATSTVVLERAGRRLVPPLSARQVRDHVDVTAPTDQLLQIEGRAESAATAQAVAQAVADSYVTVTTEVGVAAISSQTKELESRRDSLTQQLDAVSQEIRTATARIQTEGANSPGGLKDGQTVSLLRTQETALSLTIQQVKSSLDSAQGLQKGNSETKVVQPAAPAVGAGTLGRLVVDVPLGAAVPALLVGLVILVRARRDPRLRTQDGLADAAGSTVIGTLETVPQKSTAQWSTMLASYAAPPVEEWALRRMLHALAAVDAAPAAGRRQPRRESRVEHPASVLVVSLAGDDRGLAVGPHLAAFAASRGIGTRLVAASGADHAPALWAACAAERDTQVRPCLVVDKVRPAAADAAEGPEGPEGPGAADAPEAPGALPEGNSPVELTVVLVVVDQERPALAGTPSAAVSVLAASPGVATREGLARIAVALDDLGRAVDGVVVAHPDPEDVTTGHRPLRQRLLQARLPLRLTGGGADVPGAGDAKGALP